MTAAKLRIAGDSDKATPRRVEFTEARVAAFTCPAGKERQYTYDSGLRGLAVMVTANGAKAYYVVKKLGGRVVRYPIGDCEALSVKRAREKAAADIVDITNGVNPLARRRQSQADLTLGKLWEWFLKNHAKARNRSWRNDEIRYELHLAAWKSRRLSDITRGDVQRLHSKIGAAGTPIAANRALALLSVMFSKARNLGYAGDNPTKGVERFRETSRERFLQADELPRFFEALDDEQTPVVWRDFFKLCLLTGARSGNVKTMAWQDISLDRGEWRIPDEQFKTGHGMVVHLSAEAVAILRDRQNESAYVFPSYGKTRHIESPAKAWTEILERAGITGLRIHDLRRTLGSWQAATGASLPVIGKSLGHRHVSTTQVYARLDINPVREAVNTATAAMMAAVKTATNAKTGSKGQKKVD